MRTTRLVFVNALVRLRALIAASAACGLLLCLVYLLFTAPGLLGDSTITLGLIDEDDSAVSADFQSYAREHLSMEFVSGEQAWLQSELVEKHISAIVRIPSGFEKAVLTGTGGAFFVTSLDDYSNRALLDAYLQEYAASLDLLALAANGDKVTFERLLAKATEETEPLVLHAQSDDERQRELYWGSFRTVMGFYLMFSSIVIIGMAFILHDDRRNGTFSRLRASSLPTASYVLGVCAAGFVSASVMVAVFLGFCAIIGLGAFIPLASVIALSLVFGLYTVCFALACGLLLGSRNAILWVIIASTTILCLLGGAYFPLEYVPVFMQQLAHISPVFWLADALASLETGNTSRWLVNLGVLALFALLFAVIAARSFASRRKTLNP